MTAIITSADLKEILLNTEENKKAYIEVSDKYLGVTDQGEFPEDVQEVINGLDDQINFNLSSPAVIFGAGFIAALTILERKQNAGSDSEQET